jgi:hypothetical protein
MLINGYRRRNESKWRIAARRETGVANTMWRNVGASAIYAKVAASITKANESAGESGGVSIVIHLNGPSINGALAEKQPKKMSAWPSIIIWPQRQPMKIGDWRNGHYLSGWRVAAKAETLREMTLGWQWRGVCGWRMGNVEMILSIFNGSNLVV